MCVFVVILYSVVEVLEKHGLQKPISYVKNSQSSEEEAHQLMVKLCRHTGRKYGLKHIHTHIKRFPWTCSTVYLPIFVFVQKPPSERDSVERAVAGFARHAAECLHLFKTRDMPPGTAPQQNSKRIYQTDILYPIKIYTLNINIYLKSQKVDMWFKVKKCHTECTFHTLNGP